MADEHMFSAQEWSLLTLFIGGETQMMAAYSEALAEANDLEADILESGGGPVGYSIGTARLRELRKTLTAYRAFRPRAWWLLDPPYDMETRVD